MQIKSNKSLKHYWNEQIAKFMKVEPRCIHFGECGGCALQHISYEDQLRTKLDIVTNILGDHLDGIEQSIVASPNQYEYRLRMDYVTASDPVVEPNKRMGLRKRKHFNHVVDMSECHLIPMKLFPKVRKVFEKSIELGIEPYDLVKKTGFLRYLIIRQQGDEAMLIIVTHGIDHENELSTLAELAMAEGFSSVYWLINSTDADSSFGDIHKYWGKQYLEVNFQSGDKDIVVNIGPNTFCQNNVPGFNLMLEYIRKQIAHSGSERRVLSDLYSGVGSIGLALADMFDEVYACEIVEESVELAKLNAKQNNIANYQVVSGDVRELSKHMQSNKPDVVIVDPPRTGLEPRGVEETLSLNPEMIIYISCNPITQAQDLNLMKERYQVLSSVAFDMFPQTYHMENVVLLKRIDTSLGKDLTLAT